MKNQQCVEVRELNFCFLNHKLLIANAKPNRLLPGIKLVIQNLLPTCYVASGRVFKGVLRGSIWDPKNENRISRIKKNLTGKMEFA